MHSYKSRKQATAKKIRELNNALVCSLLIVRQESRLATWLLPDPQMKSEQVLKNKELLISGLLMFKKQSSAHPSWVFHSCITQELGPCQSCLGAPLLASIPFPKLPSQQCGDHHSKYIYIPCVSSSLCEEKYAKNTRDYKRLFLPETPFLLDHLHSSQTGESSDRTAGWRSPTSATHDLCQTYPKRLLK